jgi:serine/threonine-protein kinase RsbW
VETKTLKVKSRTENLSVIRDFVSSVASEVNIPKDVVENIILAVDEACTNIIKHAYKFSPDGEIIVKIKTSKSKFEIKILDYGINFEPEKVPEPDLQKYYRQRRVGGLGIYLMKTLMDEVKYSTVPGKYNEVSLVKNINLI